VDSNLLHFSLFLSLFSSKVSSKTVGDPRAGVEHEDQEGQQQQQYEEKKVMKPSSSSSIRSKRRVKSQKKQKLEGECRRKGFSIGISSTLVQSEGKYCIKEKNSSMKMKQKPQFLIHSKVIN
jgi:hypothetical protein